MLVLKVVVLLPIYLIPCGYLIKHWYLSPYHLDLHDGIFVSVLCVIPLFLSNIFLLIFLFSSTEYPYIHTFLHLFKTLPHNKKFSVRLYIIITLTCFLNWIRYPRKLSQCVRRLPRPWSWSHNVVCWVTKKCNVLNNITLLSYTQNVRKAGCKFTVEVGKDQSNGTLFIELKDVWNRKSWYFTCLFMIRVFDISNLLLMYVYDGKGNRVS